MCKLSFEGFARFLMDKENYAFVSESASQYSEVRFRYSAQIILSILSGPNKKDKLFRSRLNALILS